jgi:streptogramin lyase
VHTVGRSRTSILRDFFLILIVLVLDVGAQATIAAAANEPHTVRVPAQPDALLAVGGKVWVASCAGNAVTEISRTTGLVIQTISEATYGFNCPDALAVDGTNILVANESGNSITEVSASTGDFIQTLTGPQISYPDALAVDGPNVWVANAPNGNLADFLSEIDTSTGSVVRTVDNPKNFRWNFSDPTSLAITGSDIWVSDASGSAPYEFNVATGAYLGTTRGGPGVSGNPCVVIHNDLLWVSSFSTSKVEEFNARKRTFIRDILNVPNPNQLVFTGSKLFVESNAPVDTVREFNDEGELLRIVAKSNKGLSKGIDGVLVLGAQVWTANYSSSSVTIYTL